MKNRRGIALILSMLVAAILLTLMGAFVVVNRSNSALTGSALLRQDAYNACMTGLHYAWAELELDQSWGANGFNDGSHSHNVPLSGTPKMRITVTGDSSAPEDTTLNYIEGEMLDSGHTFRLRLVNNLQNRQVQPGSQLGDVPGRSVRLEIIGSAGSVNRTLTSVLRKHPFVDSSALSARDMQVVLNSSGRQWRLRSKDPYVNQVRSNKEIQGPSAVGDQLKFRDPPRGGIALAKDDIILGGTSVLSSPSFLSQSEDAAKGSFQAGAPPIDVPDLEREQLQFPENVVSVPPGNLVMRTFEEHEWSPHTFLVDISIPPDGVPENITRWRKKVYQHTGIEHSGSVWVSQEATVIEDSGVPAGPGDGYGSPDSSNGYQGIAATPTVGDVAVLYGSDPAHQMKANLLTGEIAMTPGTRFETNGDLNFIQNPNAPQAHLKFGYEMNDEGLTNFTANRGGTSALEDPAANSAALVASGNLNIDGITTGFGSIWSDSSVMLRAKSGLRAEPDLAVAVHGENINFFAEDPPDNTVIDQTFEADWKAYQAALDGRTGSFEQWPDMSSANRRRIIGDDPNNDSGFRTTQLPHDADYYWTLLDNEIGLGSAPNFGASPFGSEWNGNITLEQYTRLRQYAVDDRNNSWIVSPGPHFNSMVGRIDNSLQTYSSWATRMDMTLADFMAEDVPLIPDVYFVGLVHAGSGGFTADTNGSSILFEGALVSQGGVGIENTPEVDFVYNRLYLDDVVRQFTGDRVKLDQVYYNIQ